MGELRVKNLVQLLDLSAKTQLRQKLMRLFETLFVSMFKALI